MTVERLEGIAETESTEMLMHLHRYQIALALATRRAVLDFGCGDGYGANMLASRAVSVLALDQDAGTIENAAHKYSHANLEFAQGTPEKLASLPAQSFSLITCFEVVEHLTEQQQEALVAQLARLLAPDGIFIGSTPDRDVKERLYRRFPDWRNPFHIRELTAEELERLFSAHFASVSLWPQGLDVASLMALPLPGVMRVAPSDAWVNVVIAGHQPPALPANENFPPALARTRLGMFDEIYRVNLDRHAEIERLSASLSYARSETEAKREQLGAARTEQDRLIAERDKLAMELATVRSELERLVAEHATLKEAHNILEGSIGVRFSRTFDRFPAAKRALINVVNAVIRP
jgi:SAM-dependent methyltransferase